MGISHHMRVFILGCSFNVFLFQLSLYYVDGGFWRETHCQRGPILVCPIPPGSDEMVS